MIYNSFSQIDAGYDVNAKTFSLGGKKRRTSSGANTNNATAPQPVPPKAGQPRKSEGADGSKTKDIRATKDEKAKGLSWRNTGATKERDTVINFKFLKMVFWTSFFSCKNRPPQS